MMDFLEFPWGNYDYADKIIVKFGLKVAPRPIIEANFGRMRVNVCKLFLHLMAVCWLSGFLARRYTAHVIL